MTRTLTIDRRFCGPPNSGNGGYVAGLVAEELGGSDCEVMLRAPPPLEHALMLERSGPTATLLSSDQVIAVAGPTAIDLAIPDAPSLAEARIAQGRYSGFHRHTFPGCFVCGPQREPGDGLRIFPGKSETGVAAPWTAAPDLCWKGAVQTRFVWAALDCPGYFAVEQDAGPALLGKIAAHIATPVPCSEELVVAGWAIESSGRKHRVGTALYMGDRPLAWAIATWLSIEPPAAN